MEGNEQGKGSLYRASQWKTVSPFQHDSLPCNTYPGGISICMHYLQSSFDSLKSRSLLTPTPSNCARCDGAGMAARPAHGKKPQPRCTYVAVRDNLSPSKTTATRCHPSQPAGNYPSATQRRETDRPRQDALMLDDVGEAREAAGYLPKSLVGWMCRRNRDQNQDGTETSIITGKPYLGCVSFESAERSQG